MEVVILTFSSIAPGIQDYWVCTAILGRHEGVERTTGADVQLRARYRIPAGGKASPSGLKGDPPRAPSAASGVGGDGSGEWCGSRGGVDSADGDGDGDGGDARALRPLSEPVADGREAVVVMVFTSSSDAEAQTESGEVRRSLISGSSSNSRAAGSRSSRPLSSSVPRESALRSPGVEGVGKIGGGTGL